MHQEERAALPSTFHLAELLPLFPSPKVSDVPLHLNIASLCHIRRVNSQPLRQATKAWRDFPVDPFHAPERAPFRSIVLFHLPCELPMLLLLQESKSSIKAKARCGVRKRGLWIQTLAVTHLYHRPACVLEREAVELLLQVHHLPQENPKQI